MASFLDDFLFMICVWLSFQQYFLRDQSILYLE
jgi:hypothetical protein